MPTGKIKAFQDNGAGGFQECETEVFESSEKTAVATINKQVASIVTKSANFTFALSEAGAYVRSTSATAITATIDTEANVNFPVGTILTIRQAGAGQVTVSGGLGVTLNGDRKTAAQHKSLQIIKVAGDVFDIIGGVA